MIDRDSATKLQANVAQMGGSAEWSDRLRRLYSGPSEINQRRVIDVCLQMTTGATASRPTAAPIPMPSRPARPKHIVCGTLACTNVCCPDVPMCVNNANDCPRAANGEGTIYECDDPGDCDSGAVCCQWAGDRTQGRSCVAKNKCVGNYFHERYGVTIPIRVVCRTNADCVNGGYCRPDDGVSTCQ